MKSYCLLFIVLFSCLPVFSQQITKERVFVLTDISNEPDDEQSLVRFFLYGNEFDVEGLVACTSCYLRQNPREDLIRRMVQQYGKVRANLLHHAAGYPTQESLESVIATGQTTYGMDAVGAGKTTAGSRLLVEAACKVDERPLWVCVWGGSNTLAQALSDARRSMSNDDFQQMLKKLRIYSISDQDDAGLWIRKEFPGLFYIVDPTPADFYSYYKTTWIGISGDRFYNTGVNYHFDLVDNPWLKEHVMNHGALGEAYPEVKYIMEGDTPTFLGLIHNGLGWTESPAYGGWGGRYSYYQPAGEPMEIWTSNAFSRDAVEYEPGRFITSNDATIWRWRQHFQHDFAARMDWCMQVDFTKANHNPIAVLNADASKQVLTMEAKIGQQVELSAKGSYDPDGDSIESEWWIYEEASTVKGAVLKRANDQSVVVDLSMLQDTKGSVHVILQLQDKGEPSLFSYRRAIIHVHP